MAAKSAGMHRTKAKAKEAAAGAGVRDRIRDLSVAAFRDHKLTVRDISKLANEVLDGAVQSIDKSIPQSSRNVLREVFDGLSEGVHTIASAGSLAVREVRTQGQAIAGKNMSTVSKRVRTANSDFLSAVKNFAKKTSKGVGTELNALVARAERTVPKVAKSLRKSFDAADGRLVELAGESARAGVRVVRRAAGGLAMGAGGLMEGLAETITPKTRATSTKKPKSAAAGTRKKAPKKATTTRGPSKKRMA